MVIYNSLLVFRTDVRARSDRTHRRRRVQVLSVDRPRTYGQRLSYRAQSAFSRSQADMGSTASGSHSGKIHMLQLMKDNPRKEVYGATVFVMKINRTFPFLAEPHFGLCDAISLFDFIYTGNLLQRSFAAAQSRESAAN